MATKRPLAALGGANSAAWATHTCLRDGTATIYQLAWPAKVCSTSLVSLKAGYDKDL